MSDTATSWIAPAWKVWIGGTPSDRRIRGDTLVWILNPGAKAANVTVRFMTYDGQATVSAQEASIPANAHRVFKPDQGEGNFDIYRKDGGSGWLVITSDNPVAPWGYTSDVGESSDGEEFFRLPMTFYRAEVEAPAEPHTPPIPPPPPPVGPH